MSMVIGTGEWRDAKCREWVMFCQEALPAVVGCAAATENDVAILPSRWTQEQAAAHYDLTYPPPQEVKE